VIALLQRVSEAKVVVDGVTIGQIASGLMVLVCAQRGDTPSQASKLADKLVAYRVFGDENDTRPSFTPAAAPQLARELFDSFVAQCSQHLTNVQTGQFGADMKVSLTNDGPVTFWLQVDPPKPSDDNP